MRRRRRGYSLVETLVAITLLGSLLGSVTLILGVMFRADRNLRDAADQQRALEQFTARFRSDAHQALSASVGKPAEANAAAVELVLKGAGDETIRYTLRPRAVDRVVRHGAAIVHRETYGLAAAGALWQIRDERKPALVSVAFVQSAPDGGQASTDVARIDAVVRLVRPPP